MVFEKFVEVGRVCLVSAGPEKGKICVIADVVDQNRALVDGPHFPRQPLRFKLLTLLNIKLEDFFWYCRSPFIKKQWKLQGIDAKWEATELHSRIKNKVKRHQMSDFDRFKVMRAKQAMRRIQISEYSKLLKAAKK